MSPSRALSLSAITLLALPVLTRAQHEASPAKPLTPADESADVVVKKLSVAPGFQVDVWASEPLFKNPVAFCFDEKGRAYVVETARRRSSVPDIRRHDPWRIENLSLRSVEDRLNFFKAKYPDSGAEFAAPGNELTDLNGDGRKDWRDMDVEGETIRLLTDTDGDGKADHSTAFAGGFKSPVTGTAAGVLASGGSVWFACIPDLWRLDGEKDGVAVTRTSLLTGFGVHLAFSGHDMHGTKIGPDGRLYWSIADTGARVTTREGVLIDNPDSGAVFRSELDGSHMELFATGLRNPQSLAWNEVGDLFTGENNADGGDAARWTHLIEGADYGWRIGWQFLPNLGIWNSEGLWQLDVDSRSATILPPVGHLGHGPAGIAYYPGSGLPANYRDHFFMADFPGGVRSFALKPKGASYALALDPAFQQDNSAQQMTGKLLWELYPSDVAFGVDGGLYVLDWVYGWEKTGKGRIFRVHHPAVDASQQVQETKKLLGEGMAEREVQKLAELLAHPDQRVRLAAQFELVRRGDPVPLAKATQNPNPRLMRLHGLWGLAQLARTRPEAANTLLPLVQDQDSEVRAQWAKFIGETQAAPLAAGSRPTSAHPYDGDLLVRLLTDPEPRVRFFAAQALGKLKEEKASAPLLALIQAGSDDPYVRAAAVTALAACMPEKNLAVAAQGYPEPMRLGVALALRRQRSPEVARFLTDSNLQIQLEAARAIHDTPIPAAYPALAALGKKPGLSGALARRVVNAAYRLGNAEAAEILAQLAARPDSEGVTRQEALEALTQWSEVLGRDRLLGIVIPGDGPRDAATAREALAKVANPLLLSGANNLRIATANACGALRCAEASPSLTTLVADTKIVTPVRIAALRALAALEDRDLTKNIELALASPDRSLVQAARLLVSKTSPTDAIRLNAAVLGKGSIAEQQDAFTALGTLPGPETDGILAAQLDLLLSGKLPPALTLDLLEVATPRADPNIKTKLAEFTRRRGEDKDPLAKWRECLEGGDAKAGRVLFAEKAEAGCMRCHKVKGDGGDVGPELAGLITKHNRAYLLQSIVEPNAVIAPGYENVVLILKNNDVISGIINAEDADEITVTALTGGKKQTIPKAEIRERTAVPSAMLPGLGEVLGKRGLRDVIEYLSTLK